MTHRNRGPARGRTGYDPSDWGEPESFVFQVVAPDDEEFEVFAVAEGVLEGGPAVGL